MPNTFHCVARDLPQAGCMGTGIRKSQTTASLQLPRQRQGYFGLLATVTIEPSRCEQSNNGGFAIADARVIA
jgi:hypothetical protein